MVPCGFVAGVDGKDTPDHPLGVTFAGRAWSEHKLLRLAYAYEQASDMRKPPPGLRALEFNLLSSRACRRARALRRDAQKSSDVCFRGESGRTAASPECRLVDPERNSEPNWIDANGRSQISCSASHPALRP